MPLKTGAETVPAVVFARASGAAASAEAADTSIIADCASGDRVIRMTV